MTHISLVNETGSLAVDVSFLPTKEGGDTIILLHHTPFLKSDISLDDSSLCRLLPRKKAIFLCLFQKESPEFQYHVSSKFSTNTNTLRFLTFGKYGNKRDGFQSFFQREDLSFPQKTEEDVSHEPSEDTSPQASEVKYPKTRPPLPETRLRTIPDPESNILLSGTKENVVGSFFFEPRNEPAIIEKLAVQINGVDTTGIFPDIPDDQGMVEAVSLWHQDGTPFLKKNGEMAKSGSIQSNGIVLFEGLQVVIPEEGERIFVTVDTLPMVRDRSGSTIFVTIPFLAGNTRIIGYFSQKEMVFSSDIPPKSNPHFFIVRSRLQVEEDKSQPNTPLHSGKNNLLKFTLSAEGDREVFLQNIGVEISAFSHLEQSFSVTSLRLLQGGEVIASLSGEDLTGKQTLMVGSCATGDSCYSDSGNRYKIKSPRSFLIEANISSTGNFSGDEVLGARIYINGTNPGEDGFLWEDYGSGENDGISLQWMPRNDDLTELFGEVRAL